jgi:hypothetical protein
VRQEPQGAERADRSRLPALDRYHHDERRLPDRIAGRLRSQTTGSAGRRHSVPVLTARGRSTEPRRAPAVSVAACARLLGLDLEQTATALGWTASEEILEARHGFFHAAGGGYDPCAIVDRLGKPWTFANPGTSIKPFPSGSLTHPATGEMLRLIQINNIKAADVATVDMGGNSAVMAALMPPRDMRQTP